jgi:drug/metabolite transporter (DMT)-like permease
VAALVAVQVLFGGLAVAGKLVLPFVPPLALALCRVLAAALVLVALERIVVRSPLPPPRDVARFALFALLGVVLNQGLYLTGLQHTTATDAILLIATIPAFTLLVAVAMRQERKASALRVGGLAVSFAGVAVLVAGSGVGAGPGALLGDLFVLLNSLSYSFFLVLSRPTLERYDPLTLIAWVFALGVVEMALVALPAFLRVDWGALTPAAWSAFAYALVGATILTYGLNNWALRHASASRVASFVYLQPLVGALGAAWILGERLTWRVAASGALILAGVALANRTAGRARRAANPAE